MRETPREELTRRGNSLLVYKDVKDVEIKERLGGGEFSDVFKGLWQVEISLKFRSIPGHHFSRSEKIKRKSST